MMKLKKFLFILSCFIFHSFTIVNASENPIILSDQTVYKINLQSAMDLAVQHSYNLKAAQANTNSAQYSKDQAFRAFGPNLGGEASHLWRNTTIDKGAFNSTQDNLTATGTLTITQPILGLLSLTHNVEQKNISLKISRNLESASKSQAALLGAQYYLNLQLAMQQLAIAQADLVTLQKSKQDADSLFQTGSIYKDDYLRILLQFTQAQQSLVSARSTLDIARFSLAQSLGIENYNSIEIQPEVVSDWEKKKLVIPNLEEAKQLAVKENQSIKIAQENVKLSEINKTISVDNYLPALNAVASYTKNFNSYTFNDPSTPEHTIKYGFQLTWNIWDWGVRAAQNNALTEQIMSAKYQSETEKETILNNVVSQYYSIVNNLNAVKTAIDSVATAEEAFNLVSFRFLNGQVMALDLVTAQQNLTTSKASLAQARFNLDLAWLTFQTILGKNPSL